MKLADTKKLHVLTAIVEHDYNLEEAARALGVSKRTLYRLLIQWGLPSPIGGRPETTLWSEHLARRNKILKALQQLQKGETQ